MQLFLTLIVFLFVTNGALTAERLDLEAVNGAQLKSISLGQGKLNAAVLKAQILLDRARYSPGEIDGKAGENFEKAVMAFETAQGLSPTGSTREETWQKLAETSSEPVLENYTLSADDVRGPFVKNIPRKLEEKKDFPSLGYASAQEKIAEKFHMSQELLTALNPGEQFETPGRTVVVASKVTNELPDKAYRLEVDKTRQTLKVFNRRDNLMAVYPATVGSIEKPAPSGRLKIRAISKNPTYRYDPEYAFKGVRSTTPFTIKPGPNNPVGVVWIGLTPGKGYGIHGTPEPSKVSKSESHGCVRLTNWDALTLAGALTKGTLVDFHGDEQNRQQRNPQTSRKKR